jgi:signal transduction histidine kinase
VPRAAPARAPRPHQARTLSTQHHEGSPLPVSSGNGEKPSASARAPSPASALRSAERERDAAEASRDRFSFLAEVSRCLAGSLDYEATLTTVAGMSLPYLDAWCIVDVLTEEGEVRRLAVMHPDPAKQEAARRLHALYPPAADDLMGAPRVIRTGRPEMVFEVPDSALVASARDREHLELLRTLGVCAYVIVPMVARGHVLGAMTFVTAETGRRFGDVDVVMAEDLARRAAMAVDNARLHDEAMAARDTAEAALAEAEAAMDEAAAAEDELRRARDAAEDALRLRDEFVSTMTHEVQTPLNAIVGYLQLLEMDVSGALGDTQRMYVQRGQESARHLLRLVGDVLDFSRSETAGLDVAHDRVSVADTVRGALALVLPQARGRLLTLADETCEDPAPRFVGDEHRVRQILVNLLSNAVKFTPPGGRVTLECESRQAGPGEEVPEGRWLLFRVTDSGEGVKDDDAERIFEPFVQGSAGLTRRHGGTGLGLPISRRLAQLMGGDVSIERGPGPGATFTLRLPAAADDPAAPARAPERGRERRRSPDREETGRALAAAGETLLRRVSATVEEFVLSARADATLGFTDELSDVDVADHLGTLVIDVANSLAVLAASDGEPSQLLSDGSRIQRLIGELHGAQRRRLGWTEAQLVREVDLVREVCQKALRRATGADPRAGEAAALALERLLDERERACLSGFRSAAAEPV